LFDRDRRPSRGAHGGARPRHRRHRETTLNPVPWPFGLGPAAHSCAPPARSDVRSAAQRSALSETVRGEAEVNFFSELKRRNVYKVAVAYAIVGWLLIQIATQVFPFFEIPNWAVRLVVLAIVVGFPIALVMAWAFELTPEGIKRTEDIDLATQPRAKSHAWIYVAVIGALLSIALFFVGRYMG